MIASWMFSAVLVSAIFALIGSSLMPLSTLARVPRRWLWLTLMIGSAALPLGLALRADAPATAALNAPAVGGTIEFGAAANAATNTSTAATDQLLLTLWGAASLALLLVLTLTHRRALGQLATWETRALFGERVLVSPDFGPAAVGLVRARVVLPEWVFELPPEEQQLVLLHEQQHIRAGDQLVLLAGIALVVLMPWNLGLWWQLQRLRVAMELDCDARVAPHAVDRPRYGRMLLRASNRSTALRTGLAFTQTPSALVERLSALLDGKRPSRRTLVLRALAGVAGAVVVAAIPIPRIVPVINALLPKAQMNEAPPIVTNVTPNLPLAVTPKNVTTKSSTIPRKRRPAPQTTPEGAQLPTALANDSQTIVPVTVDTQSIAAPPPILTAMRSGAAVARRTGFDTSGTWRRLGNGDSVLVYSAPRNANTVPASGDSTAPAGTGGRGGRGSADPALLKERAGQTGPTFAPGPARGVGGRGGSNMGATSDTTPRITRRGTGAAGRRVVPDSGNHPLK